MTLNSKIPAGPIEKKWEDYKGHVKLVNPANKRKLEIIIVGTGLAGASAAASLGELGYKVKTFSKIRLVVRTQLQHKVVSMQQRIIKTTAILFTVYFMIPLKVVIIELAKVMFIV